MQTLFTLSVPPCAPTHTPSLGTSITLTAGAGGALNGPDFRIAKLAGFTLDNGAAIVETESAAQADVVASLPTSEDTADVAKDYDAAADGDALVKPSDDGSTLVVSNVQNLTQLPLTGSGGIALFVAIGGLLAAAGAVSAVITRRKAGALRR